jgi:hypothetical protein
VGVCSYVGARRKATRPAEWPGSLVGWIVVAPFRPRPGRVCEPGAVHVKAGGRSRRCRRRPRRSISGGIEFVVEIKIKMPRKRRSFASGSTSRQSGAHSAGSGRRPRLHSPAGSETPSGAGVRAGASVTAASCTPRERTPLLAVGSRSSW